MVPVTQAFQLAPGPIFKAVKPADVAAIVRATPTGVFARRAWFLYEWLTGRELDVPDPGKVRVVAVVDPELHMMHALAPALQEVAVRRVT